jgi:hypothetical protein
MVENVLELLDDQNEFYHDHVNEVLYWAPNATDYKIDSETTRSKTADLDKGAAVDLVPPAADALVAVKGKVLLSVTGSQQQPAHNITLLGLTFRDAAPTFLDPHDLPSQGDWGLVHSAAVVAKGTEGFTLQGCRITRVDGQGVLLEGYHRHARIILNDFEWIGSHAMVSWGKTSPCLNANCTRRVPHDGDGPDGRNGDQPIGTLVEGNVVRETGIYERQGVMWNQAISAQTTLKNNIFFNCDRAALNINDGFGGGNQIEGNLLFNTGRGQNKDEGSINAWDRSPYITTLRNGTASTVPAWINITRNFLIANYNPSLAIDNDDGSSYYHHTRNFIVYGQTGLKFDFGAHDVRAVGNYYAYIDLAFNTNGGGGAIPGGQRRGSKWFVNNTVILGAGSASIFGGGYGSDCPIIGRPDLGKIFGNTIHSKDAVMVPCLDTTAPSKGCVRSCTLQQWVAEGHDNGTTAGPVPRDEEVIAAAKRLLGMAYS